MAEDSSSGNMPSIPRSAFSIILIIAAFFGIGEILLQNRDLWAKRSPSRRIGYQFEPLLKVIPEHERLSFISDARPGSLEETTLLYHARYALAPHVVLTNTSSEYVVVTLMDPEKLENLIKKTDLVPILITNEGSALFKRRDKN